jgi:propionyl-CoA synthetase
LRSGHAKGGDEVGKELVALVRDRIGPVAAFKLVTVVPRLPKTRSGKILRGTMKKMADGTPFKAPATIDDPAILGEIRVALEGIGYAKESHSA